MYTMIMVLVNTTNWVDLSRGKVHVSERTRDAVIRQVDAMHVQTFEVGVFDAAAEQMIPRTWSKEALVKSVAWLRFENLQGQNIYVRPSGVHSLSLIDDLKG